MIKDYLKPTTKEEVKKHLKDILDECENFFGGKETGQIEHNVFEIAEHLGIKITNSPKPYPTSYYTQIPYGMYVALYQDTGQTALIREPTGEVVKITYDGLMELLNKAKWKWEHIGIEGDTIRVHNRFYGNNFIFKEEERKDE